MHFFASIFLSSFWLLISFVSIRSISFVHLQYLHGKFVQWYLFLFHRIEDGMQSDHHYFILRFFFSSIAISGNGSYLYEKRLFKCSLEKTNLFRSNRSKSELFMAIANNKRHYCHIYFLITTIMIFTTSFPCTTIVSSSSSLLSLSLSLLLPPPPTYTWIHQQETFIVIAEFISGHKSTELSCCNCVLPWRYFFLHSLSFFSLLLTILIFFFHFHHNFYSADLSIFKFLNLISWKSHTNIRRGFCLATICSIIYYRCLAHRK